MTEERHVYLEAEEFEAFLRGVPVERETDGLDLTIFPPQDPGVRQWASRLAERRDREDDFLVLVADAVDEEGGDE